MELKRVFSIVLALVLVVAVSVSVAAQEAEVLSFAGISVAMPEIKVEITGSGYNKTDISATLDNEKLNVVDVVEYENEKISSCAYVLVDLSTSMYSSFNLVKKNIISYIETLSENDKIILITFGENDVNTLLTGTEDRATAISVVNGLNCNENGTLFYEALNKAYQMSNSAISKCDREYVIAFSDGIDVQKGSSTFDEVLKLYNSHSLPLYAACSNNASKSAADRFGELARASGGSISIIKNENVFNEFVKDINDITLIKLKGSTNFADGKEKQLSLKVGSLQIEYNIPITRSTADNVAPTVEEAYYDIEKDAFIVAFSEQVTGALSAASYKITYSNGNNFEVSDVFYSEQEDVYEIKTKDSVRKGEYTIDFSGIKDASKESNQLVGKQTVSVEKGKNRGELSTWVIAVIAVSGIIVVAVVIIILVVSSNKKSSDNTDSSANGFQTTPIHNIEYDQTPPDMVKHHIKTNDAIRIRLRIITGKSSEQNIETSIVSSLIVGRSDTCDIYIDDTKLSRQHFVIENDNGNFYIMDLQSRNGTMLNGIKINSRQQLFSGDKILAGLSDIIITIIGR